MGYLLDKSSLVVSSSLTYWKNQKVVRRESIFYRSQFASSFNYGGLKVGGRVITTIFKFFKATKGAWWMPWL